MTAFGSFMTALSSWLAALYVQGTMERTASETLGEAQEYARLANKYSNSPGTFSCTANGMVEYRDPKGRLQTRRALTDLDRRRLWNWSRREVRDRISDGEPRA